MLTRYAVAALLLAASVVSAQENTTLGGYGELHYNDPDGTTRGTLDFHRFVLYLGHTFNDRMSFKSEIELEHTKLEAGAANGGEIAIEQAYLDWHLSEKVGLRAGILLPPVGIINQIHEPPTFHGVERPNVDRVIVPTTWRESGAGIYGTLGEGVGYQLYVVAGLLASGFEGSSGIRGGRQEALESSPTNPSLTGRLDYNPAPELKIGGSFFAGNTTDGDSAPGSGSLALLCGDARYSSGPWEFRALAAFETIGDADKINTAYGTDVGDNIYGWYVEGAYDILPLLAPESDHALSLFGRYEKYDTHAKVGSVVGTANSLYNRNDVTFGATYKPTYNTVFKIDYQFFNSAGSSQAKQLNLGVGYSF
jgi:hypothetical protein